MKTMKTRYEQMTTPGATDGYQNFLGDDFEYRTWFGVVGRSRDSSCAEESNFWVALKRLGGEGRNVRVERYSHWAIGWVEEVYVRPRSKQKKVAEEILQSLENHPVLDDEDVLNREMELASEVWQTMSKRERLDHFREHRQHWSAEGAGDLVGSVVRGNHYAGCVSDLI